MSETIIVDNEYVTLWYHPEHKVIHHQFHKFTYGEPLREAFTEGAKLMEKYGAKKWLSDDRKNSALTKEDMEWADTVWRPRVIKAGYKYWAIVLPEKIVGQMNLKQIIKQKYANLGITVELFNGPDEAMQWLKSV
jgi:hypothetical protein